MYVSQQITKPSILPAKPDVRESIIRRFDIAELVIDRTEKLLVKLVISVLIVLQLIFDVWAFFHFLFSHSP